MRLETGDETIKSQKRNRNRQKQLRLRIKLCGTGQPRTYVTTIIAIEHV